MNYRRIRLIRKGSLLGILLFLLFQLFSKPSTSNPPPVIGTPSSPPPVASASAAMQQNYTTVTKVIDGDTIVIASGEHVRYIGINAPETTTHACFSEESKQKNMELVLGKQVLLVKDISETDKYNRLLRYIYLSDGRFVNKELVKQGYALASAYRPDIRLQEDLKSAEKEAKEHNLGLWGTCQ